MTNNIIGPKIRVKAKYVIVLHLLLLVYSFSGVLSKMASEQQFLSLKFIIYYSGVIFILCVYAFAWQFILKELPLSIAFSNKAITVIWGIIWGMVFFGEKLRLTLIIGGCMIIVGIILMVNNNG